MTHSSMGVFAADGSYNVTIDDEAVLATVTSDPSSSAAGIVTRQAPSEVHLGEVGGRIAVVSATQFARPGDTTTYAIGDLVANSTTAGSVAPLSFTAMRIAAGNGMVVGCKLKKSTVTIANAAFRLHLFSASPTISTTGDNGVFASVVSGAANVIGTLVIPSMLAYANGATGFGVPEIGVLNGVELSSGQTIYGLLEALGAYAPGNAETFDASLIVSQN